MIAAMILAAAVASSSTGESSATAPVAVGGGGLHEIARVKALTPFCAAFEKHFNGAARPMIEADANVGFLGFSMGGLETHFHERGGELRIYDDRTHMMAYVDRLQHLLPQAQDEINSLREAAKLAPDADTGQADRQLAADLQSALDKQKQIATDSLGVVQALTDFTLSPGGVNFEDLGWQMGSARRAIAVLSRPDPMDYLGAVTNDAAPRASPELNSQAAGAYDDYTAHTPAERRDVRSYLRWQHQLDRVGDAESSALLRADRLAENCR